MLAEDPELEADSEISEKDFWTARRILLCMKKTILVVVASILLLPTPAPAATQIGNESVEYASALSHVLQRSDGVVADTTTMIAMRSNGTGWIRMKMCTATECNEIFDTLTSTEYWRGPDEETIEFFLQADIEGLGWADVAIGNLAEPAGGDQSINQNNRTLVRAQAELGGWAAEAVNHSSSTWGDWRPAGSRRSFNAFHAQLVWAWA